MYLDPTTTFDLAAENHRARVRAAALRSAHVDRHQSRRATHPYVRRLVRRR